MRIDRNGPERLSQSIGPRFACALLLDLPYALGAFLAGGLAALAMLFVNQRTRLKEDAVIGRIFTGFFGAGLFINSLSPAPVSIQTIIVGNILAITQADTLQIALIGGISMLVLIFKWKDLLVAFFDERHAHSIGLRRPVCGSSSSRCSAPARSPR